MENSVLNKGERHENGLNFCTEKLAERHPNPVNCLLLTTV